LNRMLAKSPADRYSSMAAVIEALRPFARDEEFEIHDPRDSGLEDLDYDTRVFDSSDLLDARPATTVGNLAQGEPTSRTGSLLSKRSSARKGEFTLAAFDVGTRGCVLAEAVGQRSENSTATIELPRISTLPHRDGSIQSPAAVFATDQRQILTGAEALNHFAADPRHGWLSPLSLLGHQGEMRSAYGLKPPAPLLVAILLERMSREFQTRSQEPNGFAIGVPHLFNETQRHALRQAAQMAQIESPIWVDDALADAAAYAWLGPRHNEVSIPENSPWMLLHVGESTTTMLLLNSVDGKLTVLGGENDRDLGGSHWDQALGDLAADAFRARYGSDPREQLAPAARLLDQCEDAKRRLDRATEVTLEITGEQGVVRAGITRSRFQRQTTNLLQRLATLADNFLERHNIAWHDLGRLVLSGGGTRSPAVRRLFAQRWGKEPRSLPASEETTAQGIALLGALHWIRESGMATSLEIPLVNPWSLGIMAHHPGTQQTQFSEVIPPYAPLPLTATKTFRTRRAGPLLQNLTIAQALTAGSSAPEVIGQLGIRSAEGDLPAGSSVAISLGYLGDGRLTWSAAVNGVSCEADFTHAESLTAEDLAKWSSRWREERLFDLDEIGLAEE
ncbi:MAG: Hsp70 family protein, partial [Planctomycetales bacterium]|nr:Hsp70 family protein [Planctomycetales bacterium]